MILLRETSLPVAIRAASSALEFHVFLLHCHHDHDHGWSTGAAPRRASFTWTGTSAQPGGLPHIRFRAFRFRIFIFRLVFLYHGSKIRIMQRCAQLGLARDRNNTVLSPFFSNPMRQSFSRTSHPAAAYFSTAASYTNSHSFFRHLLPFLRNEIMTTTLMISRTNKATFDSGLHMT